jgi:hypothetical protein
MIAEPVTPLGPVPSLPPLAALAADATAVKSSKAVSVGVIIVRAMVSLSVSVVCVCVCVLVFNCVLFVCLFVCWRGHLRTSERLSVTSITFQYTHAARLGHLTARPKRQHVRFARV